MVSLKPASWEINGGLWKRKKGAGNIAEAHGGEIIDYSMPMKAGKHFVIKDSTEMRFEVIFCFDAHTRIYPKEPQN